MKKSFKGFVILSILFAICLPVFSQPNSKSVETFTIDNFDTDQEWTWATNASRFIADGYPKIKKFQGMPNSLKPFYKDSENEPMVLGVQTAFNRKGDNWVEIYPVKDDKNYEIPLIGHVDHFDFWVWGANYLYYLEMLVRDANGQIHVVSCGNLRFNGWKNLVVSIPGWMVQKSRLRSGPQNLTFVGFRVRSDGAEFVDDFTIYFDQFKYMSNSMSYIFDGYELKDADSGSQGSSSSSNSTAEAK